jgi:molecular chaperone GrpE (heat shock protein)
VQLDGLDEKLTQILDLYEEKIRYDAQKEKAFDTLYDELTMYKNNFVEQSLAGVYKDLILLYDNVVRHLQRLADGEQESGDTAEFGEFVLMEILEVLYRRGIQVIEPSPEYFDPSIQRAVDTEYIDDPEKDNKVLRVVRRGFQSEQSLIRPEEVVVAKYGDEGGQAI